MKDCGSKSDTQVMKVAEGNDSKELVKMSELVRLSEVPAPTIKHYIREGLLPPPALRTSRNMAYYDPEIVPRIKQIKELQKNQFLPLTVIRDLLEGAPSGGTEREMIEAVARVLEANSSASVATSEELMKAGLTDNDLTWMIANGFAEIDEGSDNAPSFSGDSLELLMAIAELRGRGITTAQVPIETLSKYAELIHDLVEFEASLYRAHIAGRGNRTLSDRTEVAVTTSEKVVTLLRRKALIPALMLGREGVKKA